MALNKRDKAIIEDLKKFRVLDRKQITQIHFSHLKQASKSCNNVLKRLRRDGHIEADTQTIPYNYFPIPSIKKDSTKIPHFKAIANFYLQLNPKPTTFEVEWKTGDKGSIEPDIFMIWKGTPFFVEIQRNVYSKKVMDEKYERYSKYYHSEKWKQEPWQPENKKYFPFVWFITDHIYTFPSSPVRIWQTKNIEEFTKRFLF